MLEVFGTVVIVVAAVAFLVRFLLRIVRGTRSGCENCPGCPDALEDGMPVCDPGEPAFRCPLTRGTSAENPDPVEADEPAATEPGEDDDG